eukprot:tig00000057_g27.t1
MDFSEAYKGALQAWSRDGRYLAVAVEYRLVVRDVETLQIVQAFTCQDAISEVEWSADSKYILCALYKRSLVQIWSVEQPDWYCKIDEGPARIVYARWSPDGRHVLTVADFQVRLAVWSLVNKSCTHIKYPKFGSAAGIDFSKDGRWMALAVRRDCKDYVQIYACDTWELVKQFQVDTTDLAGLSWSPDGYHICVWDTPTEYKVLVYVPDGTLASKYQAYENALGVRCVSWSPKSEMLAVGSYDSKARLLNSMTWRPISDLPHGTRITAAGTIVYREVPSAAPNAAAADAAALRTKYVVADPPVPVSEVKPETGKPNPKLGVQQCSWDPTGRFLLCRNESTPSAAWVWDVGRLSPAAVLIQLQAIKAAAWDPVRPRLALATGNGKVFLWTPEGASCVDVPLAKFAVQSLQWSPDGGCLLLRDRERFSVAFMVPERVVNGEEALGA